MILEDGLRQGFHLALGIDGSRKLPKLVAPRCLRGLGAI